MLDILSSVDTPKMPEQIADITKRYLSEKTLEKFARGLGIDASKQMVWYWKMGRQKPHPITLFRIQGSPKAAPWAKEFARECLEALRHNGEILEADLDKESERRR